MDKILITAFLSALAGFITAVLSIVKLVNEKESKTTDYRQSWTDSVRAELAALIGLMNAQASHVARANKAAEKLVKLKTTTPEEEHKDFHHSASEHVLHSLKENQALVRETRQSIYQSYARARLHFKPDDISFSRVEQHFNVVMGLLEKIEATSELAEVNGLKEKVHSACNEMTGFCRHILKTEWETVKRGERAYELTKKWSIAGSIVMLFLLVAIGIHAAISMWRSDSTDQRPVRQIAHLGTGGEEAYSQNASDSDKAPSVTSVNQVSQFNLCSQLYPSTAVKAAPTQTSRNQARPQCSNDTK